MNSLLAHLRTRFAFIVLARLSYHYQRHNINCEAATYYHMLDKKLNFLYYAIWAFGTALMFFTRCSSFLLTGVKIEHAARVSLLRL